MAPLHSKSPPGFAILPIRLLSGQRTEVFLPLLPDIRQGTGIATAWEESMKFRFSFEGTPWKVLFVLLLLGAFFLNPCSAASLPPTITVQPQSQSVLVQGSVTFQVSVSSLTTLSYQWRKNGVNISGATSSNYVISAVQTNDQAAYSVKVTNAGGTVTSSNANLTVLVPPTITIQPVSQAGAVGQNISFATAANGTTPLTYQWLFNGDPLDGATNNIYTVINSQRTNAGSYSVRISNIAGTAFSSNAVLSLVNPIVAADNASSASSVGTTLSWSHTVHNGNNRFLIVGVTVRNAGTTVTSASYGGQNLTLLGQGTDGAGALKVVLYGLMMPVIGTANIVVVIDSVNAMSGGAVSFNGVSQYSPTGAFASAGGSGVSGSLNLSSATNEVVVSLMGATGDALSLTPNDNQVPRWNISSGNGNSDVIGAGGTAIGNPTTALTWTLGASKAWALAAVALKPAYATPGVTWIGGGTDDKWSSGANWFEGGAPLNSGAANLIMSGTNRLTPNVDSNWNFQGLSFDNNAGAFTISGNPLSISTNGITNFSASAESINNDIMLRASARISSVAGPLSLGGSFNPSNYAWYVSGSGNVAINGSISGSGPIIRDGTGTLTLAGANSFSGAFSINSGFVTAMNGAAFGTTAGGVTVFGGAALRLQGNIAVGAESLTLNGSGGANDGALRNLSGNNTWGGSVTLAGASTVGSDADTLTLSGAFINNGYLASFTGAGNTIVNGVVSGTGGLTKGGSGTLTLGGINSFSGPLVINAGVFRLGTNNVIVDTVNVTMGGGTFACAGFSEAIKTLSLAATSTIDLGNGNSVLEFDSSSGVPWAAGATLFVTNWNGSHSGGGAEQLYIGGNSSGLTAAQLAQVRFLGANGPQPARILSSGEIVPVSAELVTTVVGPTTVVATSNLTYTITVTNLGPSLASNVVVSDILPVGCTFVSASGGGTNVSGLVNWILPSFAIGAGTNFALTVTAPLAGILTNTVSSSTLTFDPNPANNNGSATNAKVVTSVAQSVSLGGFNCAKAAASTNLTWSQTVSNSFSRVLIVGISLRQRNSTISSVTYGGLALTNIISSHNKNGVELWGLVAPPVGTANVVVNWSGTSDMVGWSGVFNNVDQSSPIRNTGFDFAASTTPAVTVNAIVGDLVIDTISATGDALSAQASNGQTEICNDALGSAGTQGRGASSYRAGAASTPMSWTLGQSKNWDIAAVVLTATTKVPAPPTITAQPQSLTVAAGSSATLSVTATNPLPLRYQWQVNGTPLLNATNATLIFNPVQVSNAGNYIVVVANDGASITSDVAVLAVTNPPSVLSIIGTGGATSNGFAFRLSAAIGSTYIIQASTNLQDWSPISTNIATNSSFILTDLASTNYSKRFYRAVVP